MKPTYLVATTNRGKFSEITNFFGEKFNLISMNEKKIDTCDEIFETFVENALLKARYVSKTTNKFDNSLVFSMEGPAKFFPLVLGFFVATSYLTIETQAADFLETLLSNANGPKTSAFKFSFSANFETFCDT